MDTLISIAPLYGRSLSHSGTKGQKWGLRRYQNEDGTYTEEGKRRRRKDHPDYVKAHSKNVRDMSDEELASAVRRINNERIYSQSQSNKKEPLYYINKFTKYAGGITAAIAAGTTLYKIGNSETNKIINKVGDIVVDDLNKGLKTIYF